GFDGVVGVFYSNEHGSNWWQPLSPSQWNALMAGNDPSSLLYAPDNNVYSETGGIDQRQTAEFGELTYHFTDSLSLTGGLRHYDMSGDVHKVQSGWFMGLNVPGVVVRHRDFSGARGFVYKGNLSYQLTPNHLLYAQYAEGFRPGGNGSGGT